MRTEIVIMVLLTAVGCRGRAADVAAPPRPDAGSVAAAPAKAEAKVPDIDACTLLDRSDVVTIFGALRDKPMAGSGIRGEHECHWTNETGRWLKISLYGADRWDLERGTVSEMHPRDIKNLGDEAFAVKQGTDAVIHVRQGGSIVELSCSCSMDTLEKLAPLAVAKLKGAAS